MPRPRLTLASPPTSTSHLVTNLISTIIYMWWFLHSLTWCSCVLETVVEGHMSSLDRANMIQFMGRRNQIEFFVRFKADRSLKYLQYDPYVYHVVYQCAVRLIYFFSFTVDNGGSQKTEIISNTWRIHSHKRGVLRYYWYFCCSNHIHY